MAARGVAYDAGMSAAIAAAGGRSALARRLKMSPQALKWRACPRDRVFDVERASGVDAEALRPDLADWIKAERRRRRMAAAASRFSVVAGRTGGAARPLGPVIEAALPPGADDLVAWGVAVMAVRFAAAERGLSVVTVWRGESREALSAKSYAMVLAHVAARISSTTVAEAFGGSRQNVENAAARYLRARDGDDADDAQGGRVIERGRVRRAKGADDHLWAAELRFLDQLTGERKRA